MRETTLHVIYIAVDSEFSDRLFSIGSSTTIWNVGGFGLVFDERERLANECTPPRPKVLPELDFTTGKFGRLSSETPLLRQQVDMARSLVPTQYKEQAKHRALDPGFDHPRRLMGSLVRNGKQNGGGCSVRDSDPDDGTEVHSQPDFGGIVAKRAGSPPPPPSTNAIRNAPTQAAGK